MLVKLTPVRFGSLYRKASGSNFEWVEVLERFAILATTSLETNPISPTDPDSSKCRPRKRSSFVIDIYFHLSDYQNILPLSMVKEEYKRQWKT